MTLTPQLLEYFDNPQHCGELDPSTDSLRFAELGAAQKDYWLRLYLSVKNDKIVTACFKAYGSPYAIAASEYLCRWLSGKKLTVAKQLTARQLQSDLQLSNQQLPVLLLLERLVQQALKE